MEEEQQSKYSSGVNIIIRLDQLWKNCHSFKRNGQYSKWNEELDSVWLELARDLKEEKYYDLDSENNPIKDKDSKEEVETEGFLKKFQEFDKMLSKHMPFKDSGGQGFQGLSPEDREKRSYQYKILMEKQLFLARLENEIGKGTTYEEEDEDF